MRRGVGILYLTGEAERIDRWVEVTDMTIGYDRNLQVSVGGGPGYIFVKEAKLLQLF